MRLGLGLAALGRPAYINLGRDGALLGDRIAVYQVHSLTPDSPVFTDQLLLEALHELSAHGVRVGCSTSGPAQVDVVDGALALRIDGQPVFTAVQSTWNVLEPSVGAALARAHDGGAHVLVKEVLANGRLVAGLSQSWADTVLLGPASAGQLSSNLDGLTLRLSEEDLARLDTLAEPAEDYWSVRSALGWQ